MTRYAITAGMGSTAPQLAAQATRWAADGIDLIQLREPTLTAGELYAAARAMLAALESSPHTKLLINSRADVALAAPAHGVHLTSRAGELTPSQVRTLYAAAALPRPIVAVSCHTLEDVLRARDHQADLLVFGPVFEKRRYEKDGSGELLREGSGLDLLCQACLAAGPVPVLALGGVTRENTRLCLEAGAQGIAAIRLFAQG